MRQVSDDFKTLTKQFRFMSATVQIGDNTVSAEDLIQNSLEVDYTSHASEGIELGGCVSALLTYQLANTDKTRDLPFYEGETLGTVTVEDSDGVKHNCVLGRFITDKVEKNDDIISISCLDSMIYLDKAAEVSYPISVGDLTKLCIDKCIGDSHTYAPELYSKTFANFDYIIPQAPNVANISYRQLLYWCCQLMGVCCYVGYEGNATRFRFKHFGEGDSVENINGAVRFGGDISPTDVTITGVMFRDGDTVYHSAGDNEEYSINLSKNLLLQSDYQTVLDNVNASMLANGMVTYRPFQAEILPLVYLEPLDQITLIDRKGVSHLTFLTNYHFKINSRNIVASVADTESDKESTDSLYNEGVGEQVNNTDLFARDITFTRELRSINKETGHSVLLHDGTMALVDSDENTSIAMSYDVDPETGKGEMVVESARKVPFGSGVVPMRLKTPFKMGNVATIYPTGDVLLTDEITIGDDANNPNFLFEFKPSEMKWQRLALGTGVRGERNADDEDWFVSEFPQYRKIGDRVDVRGCFETSWNSSSTSADYNRLLGTLPEGFRPPENGISFKTVAGSRNYVAHIYINSDGTIRLQSVRNGTTAVTSDVKVQINYSFYI